MDIKRVVFVSGSMPYL